MQLPVTKWNKKTRIYVGIFVSIVVLYHILIREYTGDSVTFARLLDESSLAEVLVDRYCRWSSRLLIEAILFPISKNVLLWKLCNFIVYIVSMLALQRLTHYKGMRLTIGLLLLYPVVEMASAGWIATFLNYYWPATAGAVALISVDMMYNKERIHPILAIVFLICELFAANMELFGLLYACILTYFCACVILYKHNLPRWQYGYIVAQYLIAIGSVVYALMCPGNDVRYADEVTAWYIDYEALTPIEQFALGVNATFATLIKKEILFACFAVLLFGIVLLSKNRSRLQLAVAAIPGVVVLARTVFNPLMEIYEPAISNVFDTQPTVDAVNYYIPSTYLPFIIYMVVIVAIFVTLIYAFDTVHQGVFLSVIFFAGMITRVAMGFSPTVYASAERTFVFFDFCIIYCIVKMYEYKREELTSNKRLFVICRDGFDAMTVVAAISNIVAICTKY